MTPQELIAALYAFLDKEMFESKKDFSAHTEREDDGRIKFVLTSFTGSDKLELSVSKETIEEFEEEVVVEETPPPSIPIARPPIFSANYKLVSDISAGIQPGDVHFVNDASGNLVSLEFSYTDVEGGDRYSALANLAIGSIVRGSDTLAVGNWSEFLLTSIGVENSVARSFLFQAILSQDEGVLPIGNVMKTEFIAPV